jgi:hypothetical protein
MTNGKGILHGPTSLSPPNRDARVSIIIPDQHRFVEMDQKKGTRAQASGPVFVP